MEVSGRKNVCTKLSMFNYELNSEDKVFLTASSEKQYMIEKKERGILPSLSEHLESTSVCLGDMARTQVRKSRVL